MINIRSILVQDISLKSFLMDTLESIIVIWVLAVDFFVQDEVICNAGTT